MWSLPAITTYVNKSRSHWGYKSHWWLCPALPIFHIKFNHYTCIVIQTVSPLPYLHPREWKRQRHRHKHRRQQRDRGGVGTVDPDRAWHPLLRRPALGETNRRGWERGRERVARRPGPMQTQHHLLQWDLEWVSQVRRRGRDGERHEPRGIIQNNTAGRDGGQREERKGWRIKTKEEKEK